MHPYIKEQLKRHSIIVLEELTRAYPICGALHTKEINILRVGRSIFNIPEEGCYLFYFRLDEYRRSHPTDFGLRPGNYQVFLDDNENYSIDEIGSPSDLALRIALENEEYEKAAIIRDIIKKELQENIEKLIEESKIPDKNLK